MKKQTFFRNLALLLSLVMCISMAFPALADEPAKNADQAQNQTQISNQTQFSNQTGNNSLTGNQTIPGSSAADVYSLDITDYADSWELKEAADGTAYWMLDVVYCENPVVPETQHMVIYAPESYMQKGADGKVSVNPSGKVVSQNGAVYSAKTAPILYTNKSGGYSSSKTGNVNTGYINQGYVHVSIGARGKDTTDAEGNFIGQFPAIMVDLKAGIKFLKANSDAVPGNTERIISHGASSGGAVSTMLGASGNAKVFDPYFEEIGAADAPDDIFMALCYCPITNLSTADAGYEWFQKGNQTYFLFNAMATDYQGNDISDIMPVGRGIYYPFGSNILGGAHEDELSDVLYGEFVTYVQDLLGKDVLSDDGRSGDFYTLFVQMYSDSLTTFLSRYDELSQIKGVSSGRGADATFTPYAQLYPTADDFVENLRKSSNADEWLSWDGKTAYIAPENYDTFMNSLIDRNKMCPSLDSYNYKSNEASAFQEADGSTKHFSAVVRDGLNTLVKGYEDGSISFTGKIDPETGESADFTEEDYAYLKALADVYNAEVTEEAVEMLDIMSPVNYIKTEDPAFESTHAKYWRFQVGSADGDQGMPQAWITKWALDKYSDDVIGNEMNIIWGEGHGDAEYTYDDLYAYIDGVMNSEDPETIGSDEKDDTPERNLFEDVKDSSKYYYNAVYWAADKGITKGYEDNTFRPEQNCERREMLIFLWRIAGQPEGTGNPKQIFSDMGAYGASTDTYKAVAWGISEGIVKGYPDGTFRPKDPVARKDALIMLYRLAGKPAANGKIAYPDCGYDENLNPDTFHAILWAEKKGITHGYDDKTFRPLAECLREHIVTFLYRSRNIFVPEYTTDLSGQTDLWVLREDTSGTKYWALDVVYCENPVVPETQHLVIYAPEEYMTKTAGGAVVVNPSGSVTNSNGVTYSAKTAPMMYTNSSGGYSSSQTKDVNIGYINQGYVHVSIGARGKETQDEKGNFIGQFPAIIVDMKAGVRYLKANDALIPGDTEKIISHGASSGGALATMLGASGNAAVFDPYFKEMGAADATDDIYMALCYCPITNLSTADAGYEWFQKGNQTYFLFNAMATDYQGNDISDIMPVGRGIYYPFGSNILGGAHEDELSEVLYDEFVEYVQELIGEDVLGDDGRSGAFYTDFVQMFSDSLTTFLSRYDEIAGEYSESSGFGKGAVSTPYTEKYPTAQDYVEHLRKDKNADEWLSWDGKTAYIAPENYDVFMNSFMDRNKMCPSLDSYNYKSNEASAFQEADGSTKHFSAAVRDALNTLVKGYEDGSITFTGKKDPETGAAAEFTDEDLAYLKTLADVYNSEVTEEAGRLLDLMSPCVYIEAEDGEFASTQAKYWRFQVGSADGDQGMPQAWITKWALDKYSDDVIGNEMNIIWDRGHGTAEYTVEDMYDYIDGIEKRQVVSADEAVKGIRVLGTVDWDCSKAQAIAVEYSVALDGAKVSPEMFEVNDYGTGLVPITESTGDAGQGGYASNGNGIQPGAVLKAYVNDKPEMTDTPSGTGKYVILEVNTDFFTPFFPKDWRITMAADVKQISSINAGNVTITPSTEAVVNYTEAEQEERGVKSIVKTAVEGGYEIEGLEGFELHMLESEKSVFGEESVFHDQIADAFHATNCFDEADGEYWDLDLPYALYVPEDYDPSQKYAMILHFHDASTMGTNPMFPLTEARGPYNFASDAFQQLFKDQGLGGCIVVCPAIAANYEGVNSKTGEADPNHIMRVTTDNWTVTCVLPATWQLMDSLTEKYNVDETRIYGTGQSMGGMGILEMAAQRDNYFAAVMANSCKWGNNLNKEVEYGGRFGASSHGYFAAPTQATDPYSQIPELDADGNASDYQNWFYRISDDNMLFVRTSHEMKEIHVLIEDLCDINYPSVSYTVDYTSSHEESKADREALAKELFSMDNKTGLYQLTWYGDASHNCAWMLGHDTWGCYEWLAQRTNTEENEREKLWNLANDFELAEVQKSDNAHKAESDDNVDGVAGGMPTGKLGAGTGTYNSYIDSTKYAGWVLNEDGTISQPGWTQDEAGNLYNPAGELIKAAK